MTVPDTYAESHIGNTATIPCAAAQKTAQKKIDKYCKLASTHIFYLFAIETAGTWHEMAIELTQEIGRRITTIREDTRETTFLFQRLSMALQRGNVVSFHNTMVTVLYYRSPRCPLCCLSLLSYYRLFSMHLLYYSFVLLLASSFLLQSTTFCSS